MKYNAINKGILVVLLVLMCSGYNARAQAIMQGSGGSATGGDASTFGASGTASNYATTAFGYESTASGYVSTAFGWMTSATNVATTAFGWDTISGEYYSTAFGYLTTAEGLSSTAFGNNTYAGGDDSTAFGFSSGATGYLLTAWGYIDMASGSNSTCFGSNSYATEYCSTAFGLSSQATGTSSTAFGTQANAVGNNSTAAGEIVTACSRDEFVIGAWNYYYAPWYPPQGGDPVNWVTTDPIFEIGNGSPGNASDAMVVYKNGNTTITGSDNELPYQTLQGSHSILTASLGDARYVSLTAKSSLVSTNNSYGQFQIGNPTSNGEASIGFVSGETSMGNSPTSSNGIGNVWAVGAGVYGISGSNFGIGNEAYGNAILNISSSGYVGIGTNTPSATLEVNGGAKIDSMLEVIGNGRIDGNYLYISSGGGALYCDTSNMVVNMPSGGSFYMANVGNDGTRVSQADGTLRVGGPGQTSANLYVMGNVGIGNTTPQMKLDVKGGAYVRGSLIVTGTMVGTTVEASGTNLALVPQQGDLSMGTFNVGVTPQ